MNELPSFFWIHIKKSGGTSLRAALGDAYPQVDRSDPQPFVSLPKRYWNDNLNNYRVPLGPYDYRRALFATRFLFTDDEWARMFTFTIVRNPFDRAVSAFLYLRTRHRSLIPLRLMPRKRAFTRFLTMIPDVLEQKQPRHFATHVAPMAPDLSDNRRVLLDYVARIENLRDDAVRIGKEIGVSLSVPVLNSRNGSALGYRDFYSQTARRRVEEVYGADLEAFGYDY